VWGWCMLLLLYQFEIGCFILWISRLIVYLTQIG
jgi:hypothetical protein